MSSSKSNCRDEMTRWNVGGRVTSIFMWNVLRAKSHKFVCFFFISLKIKSHYLSTAVSLHNFNNAPPYIFTGLCVHCDE